MNRRRSHPNAQSGSFRRTTLTLFICAALAAVMLFPSMAYAQVWEELGPSGGSFIDVVTDPADADKLTAVTSFPSPCAAYGSNDGGETWFKKGDVPDSFLRDVYSHDHMSIYGVAFDTLYVTHNGGYTWDTIPRPSNSGDFMDVCVDPTDTDRIYVSAYQSGANACLKMNITSDGGDTWTTVTIDNEFHFPRELAISQSNPDVLYICGYKKVGSIYSGFVFKTADGGATWTNLSTVLEPNPVGKYFYGLAIDPSDENNVYTADAAIYRTNDGGATWAKNNVKDYDIDRMAVDPSDGNTIYATSETDVHISNDKGVTWSTMTRVVKGAPQSLHVATAMPSHVFAASTLEDGGMWQSKDSGATWQDIASNVSSNCIASIAVAPSQPETVIIDIEGASWLLASYESGLNWEDLVYPDGCSGTMSHVVIHPDDPDTIVGLEPG